MSAHCAFSCLGYQPALVLYQESAASFCSVVAGDVELVWRTVLSEVVEEETVLSEVVEEEVGGEVGQEQAHVGQVAGKEETWVSRSSSAAYG